MSQPCTFCGGTGKTVSPAPRACSVCRGSGKLEGSDADAANTADATWRKGFLHLTVDGAGLVSLWDEERTEVSYLRLPLTPEQQRLIEETMKKDGPTP